MSYSLVTYTYNDHEMVDDLLLGISSWTRTPQEIIIVDDGSVEKYRAPKEFPDATVVHNEKNMGTSYTKNRGINLATSDSVMSVDCDIRLSENWAESCLAMIQDKSIGIASSTQLQLGKNDFSSKYWSTYGDNHNVGVAGEVDFLTGGMWLFRKEVWNEVDGFSGHTERLHEDHYLCKALRSKNYKLIINDKVEAVQVRQFSRRAIAKKIWSWFDRQLKAKIAGEEHFWDMATAFFLPQSFERINEHIEKNNIEFIYLEFLYVVSALNDLLKWAEQEKGYSKLFRQMLPGLVLESAGNYKSIIKLLNEDLPELKIMETSPSNDKEIIFFNDFLGVLDRGGILKILDLKLRLHIASHADLKFDYSMYEDF